MPKVAANDTARATLRRWAENFETIGQGPGRPAMRAIGLAMEESVADRMEQAVSPSGKPHKPLSRKWVLFKRYGTTSENVALGRELQLRNARDRDAATRAANALSGTTKRAVSVSRALSGWKSGGQRRGGYSEAIWQYTGASMRRITHKVVSGKTVVILINTPYSGYANATRPVLGLSRKDKFTLDRILRQAYLDRLKGTP